MVTVPVPALPLGELGGCLGRWAKVTTKKDQKYNYVVQKVNSVVSRKFCFKHYSKHINRVP